MTTAKDYAQLYAEWIAARKARDPMDRREAIQHVIGLSDSYAMEMCIDKQERKEVEWEAHDALYALGVTDEEIEEAARYA